MRKRGAPHRGCDEERWSEKTEKRGDMIPEEKKNPIARAKKKNKRRSREGCCMQCMTDNPVVGRYGSISTQHHARHPMRDWGEHLSFASHKQEGHRTGMMEWRGARSEDSPCSEEGTRMGRVTCWSWMCLMCLSCLNCCCCYCYYCCYYCCCYCCCSFLGGCTLVRTRWQTTMW